MKNVIRAFCLVASLLFFSSSSFAGDDSQKSTQTVSKGILQILKAHRPPKIDGVLDDIWKSASATPMLRLEGHSTDSILATMHEHYSSFRTMWDANNFYVFVSVVDSSLEGIVDRGSPWNNDCVEIFINGADTTLATSYDTTCAQWRYDYPESPGDTGVVGNLLLHTSQLAHVATLTGFDLEFAIPRDSLPGGYNFLTAGSQIGLELSCGNRKGDVPQSTVTHWWTNNGLTWQNPQLFGQATLVAKEANAVVNVYKADSKHPVTVDGIMSAGEWENADEMSMNMVEGGRPLDSVAVQWKDHMAFFRLMWDDDNFYVFATVIDSLLEGIADRGSPWNNDCVELFINGADTTLATSYDTTCAQWRYDYPEAPGDTGVVGDLLHHTSQVAYKTFSGAPGTNQALASVGWTGSVNGYTLEIAIPKDSLPGGYNFLKAGSQVGFEISCGNRGNTVPQKSVLHWWTSNGLTWQNPQLFGQIMIVNSPGTAVHETPVLPVYFSLEQNYPNPFNPATKITYSLARTEKVALSVYNVLGQRVAVLVNGQRSAGIHTVDFDGARFSSGVYFYKLEAGSRMIVKKMLLLK